MKHDYNEMLHQVAEIIAEFLKKEGGMSNGYETRVSGIVKHNMSGGDIKYRTPKTDDLTGHEKIERATKLEDKIRKMLKAYDFLDYVEIKSTHTEHGCFDISVSLTISQRVSFI